MSKQGAFFELGDSAGDELARTSEDGATWTEPSLWQQGRPAIDAERASDAAVAELAEQHRATIAAESGHRVQVTPARNYYWAGCTCQEWGRQCFTAEQAQRLGIAHELNSAATPAELEAVRARHRAERAAARIAKSETERDRA